VLFLKQLQQADQAIRTPCQIWAVLSKVQFSGEKIKCFGFNIINVCCVLWQDVWQCPRWRHYQLLLILYTAMFRYLVDWIKLSFNWRYFFSSSKRQGSYFYRDDTTHFSKRLLHSTQLNSSQFVQSQISLM